ncbi:MAG: hypothetical protein FWE18_01720 [Alphaproteobacteria bacterium]|nr:hypothetical protein [Alphaproteobacteria bacterium]
MDSLAKLIDSKQFFIIDVPKNLLIETILFNNKNKIKFIVGDSSSALFQSYASFKIPALSLLKNKYSVYQLKMFRYLPDFQEFLQSNLYPEEFYKQSVNSLNFIGKRFDILYNQLLQLRILKNKKRKKIIKIISMVLIFIIFLLLFISFI